LYFYFFLNTQHPSTIRIREKGKEKKTSREEENKSSTTFGFLQVKKEDEEEKELVDFSSSERLISL